MTTYISNNLKKTSERINTNWDVIDPRTKQVIQKKEPEFVEPTPLPEVYAAPKIPITTPLSKIDELISKKIEAIINKKIEEALNKL